MNLSEAIPTVAGFEEVLKHFAEEGTLVDVFLRTYPMGYEVPKEVFEQTRTIRIVHVSEGCLVLGPKKPLVTSVIPIDEVAMVSVSAETHRADEEELDRKIEEECPDWERDFAKKLEATILGRRLVGDTSEPLIQDESSPLVEIKDSRYVVLDVFATWCQPCKEVDAILVELEEQFGDKVLFTKLDGDKYEKTTENLGISAYPTVILFEDGQIRKKIEGSRSIEYYTNEIEILLGMKKRVNTKNQTANGKVNTLSADRLMETIENSPASVIMFYEKGDYDCQLQSRVMNEVAKEYKKNVMFAKVDVDAEEELVELFEVEDAPEVYFILDGAIASYSDERLTKTELREGVEELLNLG